MCSPCVHFIVLFFLLSSHIHGLLYSSIISTEDLLRKNILLTKKLRECLKTSLFTKENKVLIDAIKRYKKTLQNLITNEAYRGESVRHPINAFHLMKHTTQDWLEISREMQALHDDIAPCFYQLEQHRLDNKLPNENDLAVVAASIGRLQYMHKLHVNDVVEGWIRMNNRSREGFRSKFTMDWHDAWLIGTSSLQANYYLTARDWLKKSQELMPSTVPLHDEIHNMLVKIKFKEREKEPSDEKISVKMGTFCRGENPKLKYRDAKLKCRYLTRNRGFLMIGPIKLEELSRDPPIMMFHDFLTEKETQRFIRVAIPKLKPSTNITEKEWSDEDIMRQISQEFWFNKSHNMDLYMKVTHRVEEATGVKAGSDVEPYQVVNYGIGGLSLSRPDYLVGQSVSTKSNPRIKKHGERVASLLLYLDKVELGGASVFPSAKVTAWPKKGAAVFWYNLFKNGTGDPKTKHGECPTLYGTKWISNKFMNSGQVLQCGLSSDEKYPLL